MMENVTSIFLSWQMIVVPLAIFIQMKLLRRAVKGDSKNKVERKYFSMFLPVYPYLIALIIVFIPSFNLPEPLPSTVIAKLLFALVVGWMPDKSFQIVKRIIKKASGK
jgi:Na+/citrate or Na+/malate symporter